MNSIRLLILASAISVNSCDSREPAKTSSPHAEPNDEKTLSTADSPYLRFFKTHYVAEKAYAEITLALEPEVGKLTAMFLTFVRQGIGQPPYCAHVSSALAKATSEYKTAVTRIDYRHIHPEVIRAHKARINAWISYDQSRIALYDAITDYHLIFTMRGEPEAEWYKNGDFDPLSNPGYAEAAKQVADAKGRMDICFKTYTDTEQQFGESLKRNAPEKWLDDMGAARKSTGYADLEE